MQAAPHQGVRCDRILMNERQATFLNIYRHGGKRILDLTLSVVALPFLLPLLGVLALVIRARLGPRVVFKQERLGFQGRAFVIRKFRTMTEARDAFGNLLPDSERLTTLGRFLRKTSLDELPELMNVLRGEMSLVGPRPLHSCYRDRYSPDQFRRHEALPGITGWAQVKGRNALQWEQKFDLDIWYVDHQSLWLDIKIVGLTILKLIKREGISQPGEATMSEFEG